MMKIKYDIEVPYRTGIKNNSEEYVALFDFIQSEHKTMCIEYETLDTAKTKISAIRMFIKRKKIKNIEIKRRSNIIYFIKDVDIDK